MGGLKGDRVIQAGLRWAADVRAVPSDKFTSSSGLLDTPIFENLLAVVQHGSLQGTYGWESDRGWFCVTSSKGLKVAGGDRRAAKHGGRELAGRFEALQLSEGSYGALFPAQRSRWEGAMLAALGSSKHDRTSTLLDTAVLVNGAS